MPAEELGRIERPAASGVLAARKLYVVPLVNPVAGAPEGFSSRLTNYWEAVDKHLAGLEARAGLVKRVFHEGIGQSGQAAIDQLKQVDTAAYRVVHSRIEAGATFEAFDDEELFLESIDWSRCLQIGFISRTVAETISEAYANSSKKRLAHMSQQLDEKLGASEAGVLIMSNTRGLKIPEGVEIFNIMPPELDELERWIQTILESQARADAASPPGPGAPDPEGETPPEGGKVQDSGLWTPGG